MYIGALQSEGRLDDDPTTTRDPNSLTPLLALAWPTLLVVGVVWAVVRKIRSRPEEP